jgi:hypothetical protein
MFSFQLLKIHLINKSSIATHKVIMHLWTHIQASVNILLFLVLITRRRIVKFQKIIITVSTYQDF